MTTEEKEDLIAECNRAIKDAQAPGATYRALARGKIACIALAALTAEPVGKFIQWDSGDEETAPEIEWVEANTKEAIPLYKCAPVAAPEGWRLVPLEPTVEMINAAQSSTAWDRVDFWEGFYDDKAAYQAMLAAAPTP